MALFGRLTASEYLRFVGRMYGLDQATTEQRTEELLEFMNLAGEDKKLVTDFSHGMQKKLALAAAVIHGPKVLFLDEPFEGVDAIAAGTLKQMLQRMIARGATIFLTSHVLEIVERLCTHIGIIHRGRLVAQGSIEQLRAGVASSGAAPLTLEQIFLEIVGADRDGSAARAGAFVAQLDDRPDLSRPARPGPARPDFTRPDLASSAYAIPASTQLLAIAWLRWRIFVNGFRRQAGSGKVAGLVVSIVLRVMLWPIVALWVVGPAVGSGFLAWMAVDGHHPQRLSVLFGGIALIWQLIAINGTGIAATVSSFDPSTLLRFPLRFGRYLVLRLLLGLMTASTIVGCLALFAAAIGITVAQPSLAAAAFVVLAIFAAMNIFLSRMIAVWMERWLSTRRAREIFTALMALVFVSFQLLNFHRPLKFRHPTGHPSARANSWLNFLSGTHPFLNWLPPGFATNKGGAPAAD